MQCDTANLPLHPSGNHILDRSIRKRKLSFIPSDAMHGLCKPVWVLALSQLVPLRHYFEVTIGIFLKGAGLDVLWSKVLWLGLLGRVCWRRADGAFTTSSSSTVLTQSFVFSVRQIEMIDCAPVGHQE